MRHPASSRPRHRAGAPRRYRLPIALAALALAAALAAPFSTVYRGLNEGITVGRPGYQIGFEWRGNIGFFADLDGADLDQPHP
ncbi:hypothetical protein [Streptomyces olivoreticuli]|uniref:hypothetical protein n=1 Tax=Streptomyces olivoreticuli TaxID=68246 RepID=UPI000E21E11A|nr:hypothetical protein [Streptomyces olivoreticuli]